MCVTIHVYQRQDSSEITINGCKDITEWSYMRITMILCIMGMTNRRMHRNHKEMEPRPESQVDHNITDNSSSVYKVRVTSV